MKPYGRRKPLKHDYTNVNPPKGYVNWWESFCEDNCKKRARLEGKNEIKRQLKEKNNGN